MRIIRTLTVVIETVETLVLWRQPAVHKPDGPADAAAAAEGPAGPIGLARRRDRLKVKPQDNANGSEGEQS